MFQDPRNRSDRSGPRADSSANSRRPQEPGSAYPVARPLADAPREYSQINNPFEATLARVRAMSRVELTKFGDLDFCFGGVKELSLTSAISAKIPELFVSLRGYSPSMTGVATKIYMRTDDGPKQVYTLDSRNLPAGDDRASGLAMLGLLEGLVLGAAQRYGELKEGAFTPASRDGVVIRATNSPHTEKLAKLIETVPGRVRTPDLDWLARLTVEQIPGTSPTASISPGFELSLAVQKLITKTPLLKCRIDGDSPVVETEFLSPGAPRVLHTFETTQAAIFFIVGVCNGALAAESAKNYHSFFPSLWRRMSGFLRNDV